MAEPSKAPTPTPAPTAAPQSAAPVAASAGTADSRAAMVAAGVPWRKVWVLPALVAGIGLFVGGTYTAISSRPKPDPGVPLREAEALVEARKFEEAIAVLNTDVKKFIDLGEEAGVTRDHRAAYHLAMARAFAGAQDQLGFSREENHKIVVTQFERAEELGAPIKGSDVTRLVESLVALWKLEEAMTRVRELPLTGSTASGASSKNATTKDAHATMAAPKDHGDDAHAKQDAHAHADEHAHAADDHGSTDSDAHADSHGKHDTHDDHGTKTADAHGADDHGKDAHAAAHDDHGADAHGAHGSHAPAHALSAPASDGLSEAQRRIRLTKLVVEANLHSKTPRDELTLELLAELGGIPGLSPSDRVWVLARQAELLLASGRAEDAIVKLLPRIRVQSGSEIDAETEGDLYLLLGRAYFDVGQSEAAAKQLEAADRYLPEGSPKRAQAELILGKIMQISGDLSGARERFSAVTQDFATTDSYLPAMLGLAEVEGAVGGSSEGEDSRKELENSIHLYAQIVDAVKTGEERRDVTKDVVTSSLLERHQDRFQAGDLETALRFAQLAESLYADEDVPGIVHASLARTHRRIADETLGAAKEKGGSDFKITDLNAVERTEIKQNYLSAAEHYKAFAASVSATDNRAYGEALWAAADSYDLAGDLEESKKTFTAYAQGASDDDPRKPEARFRLAQVFQAQKDYAAAAAIYRSLREGQTVGDRRGGSGGGYWGDQSIVPLARCLLSDAKRDNDEEAEGLLLSVVEGRVVTTPQAPEFREALIELARMYYYAGNQYAKAIERLTEAVDRYPDDRRRDELRYWLADSQRLSASAIANEMKQSLPQATRQEMERTRTERLRAAMLGYERVRDALEERPEAKRTELERAYMRNAYFYVGDCAFDLKDFDAAVKSYDAARTRYADDPASLVAMVQIVNAYVAQSRWAEARTANERATQHLARFPESVWNRPDLPMERRHWERWLEARTLLDQSATAEGEGRDR